MLRRRRVQSRQRLLDDHPYIKPVQAKVLFCALGLLVFVIDMVVPADVNLAFFYCFVILLCVWTDSVAFLWTAAAVFTAAVLPGLLLSPPPVTGPIAWVDWVNRGFVIAALWLVAGFTHLRMRGFQLLENTISAKNKAEKELRESEARLKLAQQAGRVGSWEWNPSEDTYTWSDECHDIFGIDSGDPLFAEKWMSAADPSDLIALQAGITCLAAQQEFEMDYRYRHPSRGARWIHTRAKLFTNESGKQAVFGISHDISERKQIEAFLQRSQSMLESLVEQRTAELSKLSAELIQAQDEERRRIARELHDSFGQNLASLKISLDQLAGVGPAVDMPQEQRAELLSDSLQTVERCIVETRTLSHLLHPPLLDEAGFASAARWYVEGFTKRGKIQPRLDLPPELLRLTPALELALFRALQETLTNVHRYSGSPSVDIEVTVDSEAVVLAVRDYGRGIPEDIVRKFREHRPGVGVGLSGMRERMLELGGSLEISADKEGTLVCARVPLSKPQQILTSSTNVA